MANWTNLKAAIADTITTNGNQEITGVVLQNTLNAIVNTLGENATFAGIALPTTNPGVPDGPVFYIATTPGDYPNFDVSINTNFAFLKLETPGEWTAIEIETSAEAIIDLGVVSSFDDIGEPGVYHGYFENAPFILIVYTFVPVSTNISTRAQALYTALNAKSRTGRYSITERKWLYNEWRIINLDEISAEIQKVTDDIKSAGVLFGDFGNSQTTADAVLINYKSIDQQNEGTFSIPAATTEKAGAMSAADKQNITNYVLLDWAGDFYSTRIQIPRENRRKGVKLRYLIEGREFVEEIYKSTNFSDSSWGTDSNWDYEKFKGEITSVTQSPSLDTRTGVYYTSRAKGTFINFKKSDGTAISQNKDRYFTIVKQLATGVWALSNLQPILYGIDYSWGAIVKGYISVSASTRTDENNVGLYKYRFEVFPNTAVSAINSLILSSDYQSLGIMEGVYEFESIHNKILVMANVSTRRLEFNVSSASSNNNSNGEYLPAEDKKDTHILLGTCGGQWSAPAYCYFPFVGLHMNVRGFYTGTTYGKTNEICNLSDYSFYDISSKVTGLTFKGECHLDLQDSDEDNIYYVLGTTTEGEYSFENLSLSVTTEKRYSAFAIKKKSGVWSSEEVPLSFCSQNSSAPYHMLNSGTYVIQSRYAPNSSSIFAMNVTGIHGVGNVNLIFVADSGEGALTLGDWYKVKVYGTFFSDYYQRDNSVRIENCEFTGPYWRTTGSTYFINCHFYKNWDSNVLIKNCKFTFDKIYTYVWGDKFDNIEITGCEFNVKQGSHPIRINRFKSSAFVRGNKVFGGATGIFFGSQKSLPQSGAVVENNTVMYQTEEGISCDGFGNNYSLVPVIANGNIESAHNDTDGRLVIKPHLYTGTSASDSTLIDHPVSKINNWKDYYVTFNRGTGIDGTICRIYSYDASSNTFTLDVYISAEKIRTTQAVPRLGDGSSDDSIIGVQSGFFDMVIRNNILKSDRQDYCTALSNYLNVFNTLIEKQAIVEYEVIWSKRKRLQSLPLGMANSPSARASQLSTSSITS